MIYTINFFELYPKFVSSIHYNLFNCFYFFQFNKKEKKPCLTSFFIIYKIEKQVFQQTRFSRKSNDIYNYTMNVFLK